MVVRDLGNCEIKYNGLVKNREEPFSSFVDMLTSHRECESVIRAVLAVVKVDSEVIVLSESQLVNAVL